jgi:hypothetical protein
MKRGDKYVEMGWEERDEDVVSEKRIGGKRGRDVGGR